MMDKSNFDVSEVAMALIVDLLETTEEKQQDSTAVALGRGKSPTSNTITKKGQYVCPDSNLRVILFTTIGCFRATNACCA